MRFLLLNYSINKEKNIQPTLFLKFTYIYAHHTKILVVNILLSEERQLIRDYAEKIYHLQSK